MPMRFRKIAVWVLSLLFGVASASAIVFLGFHTTLERYKIWVPGDNYVILIIALGGFGWIWFDYFLSTDMLPK